MTESFGGSGPSGQPGAGPSLTLVRPMPGFAPVQPMDGRTLLFLHVPKAAGTTLDHILHNVAGATGRQCERLRGWYLSTGETSALEALDGMAATDLATIDILTGHLPFGMESRLPRPCLPVTLLRNPRDRLRSHDRFGLATDRWTTDTPIEALIQDGRLPAEIQTRQMAGVTDRATAANEVLLRRAQTHLDDAALVGTVENFDLFLAALLALIGGPAVLYGRFQRIEGPVDPARLEAADACIDRYFSLDRALHHTAADRPQPWRRDLFEARVEPAPPRDMLLVSPDLQLGGRPATLVSAENAGRFLETLRARGARIRTPLEETAI